MMSSHLSSFASRTVLKEMFQIPVSPSSRPMRCAVRALAMKRRRRWNRNVPPVRRVGDRRDHAGVLMPPAPAAVFDEPSAHEAIAHRAPRRPSEVGMLRLQPTDQFLRPPIRVLPPTRAEHLGDGHGIFCGQECGARLRSVTPRFPCCFVTPDDRHAGRDRVLLAARADVYERVRARRPNRWSGTTRNWAPIPIVTLNPERAVVPPAHYVAA